MGICDDLAELLKGGIASTPVSEQAPVAERIRERLTQLITKVKAVPPSDEAKRELERKQAAKRSRSPGLDTPELPKRGPAAQVLNADDDLMSDDGDEKACSLSPSSSSPSWPCNAWPTCS